MTSTPAAPSNPTTSLIFGAGDDGMYFSSVPGKVGSHRNLGSRYVFRTRACLGGIGRHYFQDAIGPFQGDL